MDRELNKEIADYFLTDSREFLFRYEKLAEIQTHIANRSKLLIDLIFSLECSLKALIFIELEKDEKAIYKEIRTHDLKKLLEKVNTDNISEITEIINENFEHFSVSSRYTLEANIYFRNHNYVLDELYYSTIADFIWLDKIHKISKDLYEYVSSKTDKSIQIINFSDIDIDLLIEKANRIKRIND